MDKLGHCGGHLPNPSVLGRPAAMGRGRGGTDEPPHTHTLLRPQSFDNTPRGCWGLRGTGKGGAVWWLASKLSVNRKEG